MWGDVVHLPDTPFLSIQSSVQDTTAYIVSICTLSTCYDWAAKRFLLRELQIPQQTQSRHRDAALLAGPSLLHLTLHGSRPVPGDKQTGVNASSGSPWNPRSIRQRGRHEQSAS
ncbi:hypothetical protein EYF80_046960 [Liparis tanakae]|uniref:Uncharacterized protein n=1 Tax=Liparis tanakae TaxID=230148 RepID=A0A4Z2FNN1_9TELE|nr:hypothetical protein EYF80_046960 [Liparis tanakae]